nr:reverse transcriptase domain-containing protein [Tanacetum cinerariifolium]
MTNRREMTPPLVFFTPPHIPNVNTNERPPVTTTVFAATTTGNTPFAYCASTSTDPTLMIKLKYFSEDYDEEREMEPRPEQTREVTPPLRTRSPRVRRQREMVVGFEEALNKEGSRTERNTEGNRPSKGGAEENRRSRKSSWDNRIGQKSKYMFSLYRGPNHGLLSSLSKSPKEILATEKPLIQASKVDSQVPLVGFLGEKLWATGEVLLEITMGDTLLSRSETLNFVIVRSNSPYNMLLGRTAMQKIRMVVSTIHGAVKFYTTQGIGTVFSKHDFDKIGEDVFAWTHADMTGIPRTITVDGKPFNMEQKLNGYSHINPIKQKRQSLGPDRSTTTRKEVKELTRVESLSGFHLKCFLDAYKDYHKIQMVEEDEDKTAFRKRRSLLQPKDALRFKKCRSNVSKTTRQDPKGKEGTYALRFEFETTNNESEYGALLAGLKIAQEIEIVNLVIFVDFQLLVNQIKGIYVAKKPAIKEYLQRTKETLGRFRSYTIEHIRRNQNKKADILSKLALMIFEHLTREVLVEVLSRRSIEEKEVLQVKNKDEESWMTLIHEYLLSRLLPEDSKESRKTRIKAP